MKMFGLIGELVKLSKKEFCSEEVEKRLHQVQLWLEFQKADKTSHESAHLVQVSRATLYRWLMKTKTFNSIVSFGFVGLLLACSPRVDGDAFQQKATEVLSHGLKNLSEVADNQTVSVRGSHYSAGDFSSSLQGALRAAPKEYDHE